MTDHSGNATNTQKGIAAAGKPITREEREELRRLWEGENRAALAAGDSEEWEIVARVLAGRMFLALPRLLDTIDALEAENARLRKPRCIGCGRTEDELHASDCSHINGTLALTYEQGIRDVLRIRCVKHHDVPQYNRNEIHGGECAACAVESLRATATTPEGGE